jgi:DNA modification methylase
MKLIHGDCLEKMKDIPKGSVDLIWTSPPYYNARDYSNFESYDKYLLFIKEFLQVSLSCISDDGYLILNTSPVIVKRSSRSSESTRLPIPFDTCSIAQSVGFKYIDDIIWEKPDGSSSRAVKFSQHRRPLAYKPFTVTEYLFVFRKKDAPLIDHGIRKHSSEIIERSLVKGHYERTNVWKISPTKVKGHPAPFPISLSQNVLLYYSYVDDTVLDPFMGSGSTGIACINTKRNFIGIEKDDKYFEIAVDRIADAREKKNSEKSQ